MAGKAYGISLPLGFRGNVARTPDCIIMPFVNCGESAIQYGEPVVYDATNKGVRKVKSTDAATDIVGIAVRRMGQPHADRPEGYYYAAKETVDVLVRGTIMVEMKAPTGIAPRGAVYVCNGSGSNAAGDVVAASNSDTLAVPNAIFATGEYDSNKIAAVTILTRSI